MADKPKTISGPYQSYQIVVSVSTLSELKSMQPPGVDGAPTFFRDNGLPWFWFSQLPAGYVVSADGSNGVVSSNKSGFFVSLFKLVAAVSLGAFLTCARASANRMLDVPASTLYLVADGARTYVQSFVSGWHWESNFPAATAADNETTCRPIAWATLGLDGAFVRDLQGDGRTLAQTDWNVNSTAADNEGTGLAGDPLKTDVEIQRRWGQGKRARLSASSVTITYAQQPATQTNFIVEIQPGTVLTVAGTPIVTKPGTVLTAVQVQVRTPGAEAGWAITAPVLGAADLNKFAVITQSATPANIGAYAPILKDEGGGKVRTAPFGTSSPLAFTQVTPLVGDVIEIREMFPLQVGNIALYAATQDFFNTAPNRNVVIFDSILLDGNVLFGSIYTFGLSVIYQRTALRNITLAGIPQTTASHRCNGGLVTGASGISARCLTTLNQTGLTGPVQVAAGGFASITPDCYFQNAACTAQRGASISTQGAAFFDRAVANTALQVQCGSIVQQSGSVPDWGTNNAGHGVTVQSCAGYSYATKPTVNSGLGAGREAQIGGTDKLYTAVPYVEATNNAALVLTA